MARQADSAAFVDDRVRLLLVLAAVVATVTLPPWRPYAFVAGALAVALTLSACSARRWVGLAARALPFLLALSILVPFAHTGGATDVIWSGLGVSVTAGGLERWGIVLTRGTIAIGWVSFLGATMSPERILNALSGLRVPRRLISIMWLTFRYLHVLSDEFRRVTSGWRARRIVPRRRDDLRVLADIVGVMFLRAIERSERVHSAMLARAFSGDAPLAGSPPIRRRDAFIGATGAAAICAFVVAAHAVRTVDALP